jgi:hypothetical protein
MIRPARVSVLMDEVVATMLKTSLCKLHGRHRNIPFIVIGVASIQPPGIDLSRDTAVSTILLELIRLIWLPHRVNLLVSVSHISRNVDRAIWKPVPGQWTDGSKVSWWFVGVILRMILEKFPGSVAELGISIQPVLDLSLGFFWLET